MLAIRPPIDFPPITKLSGEPSSLTTSRKQSRRMFCGSGRRRPAAIYGNSKRTTRIPAAAMPRATVFMKPDTIGPPAPCAKTYVFAASTGPSMRNLVMVRTTITDHAQPPERRPAFLRLHTFGCSSATTDCPRNGAASDGHVSRVPLRRRPAAGGIQSRGDGNALLLRGTHRRDSVLL